MPFEIIPQKLIYGGAALGHHDGRPVLVPRVLPGERAEVEQVRAAKGVVHARPLCIVEASSRRVDPPCPYFGRCGGCHYQHFSASHQTEVKSEILRETLRRIGKILWEKPIKVHAAAAWNYRNQAQLKVNRQAEGQVELGFFEAESHRLYPVDQCLLLSPRLNAVLTELRKPQWQAMLGDCREIELLADDRDERFAMTLRGMPSSRALETVAADLLAGIPGLMSVAMETTHRFRVFGRPQLEYAVDEFRYRASPGSFFQASRFLLPELVDVVTGAETGGLALDLFAGVGLFTLPLARRFDQVVAVEANQNAAADLVENARAHSLANIRAVSTETHDFLRRYAQADLDLVVLDPPRRGAGVKMLKLLVNLRPRVIHYVSCSPPTLARDLGYLTSHGYALDSVELFDLFPQTYHLETFARLVHRAGES